MIIIILAALLTLLTVVVILGCFEAFDNPFASWGAAIGALCGVVLIVILWRELYLLMMRTIQ